MLIDSVDIDHHPPCHPDVNQNPRWMMSHACQILKQVQDDTRRGVYRNIINFFPSYRPKPWSSVINNKRLSGRNSMARMLTSGSAPGL